MTIELVIGAVIVAVVVAFFLFRQPAQENPVVEAVHAVTAEPEPTKVETVVEVDAKTVKVTKASLSKLTKQGLEDFAKANYGVDIDKRKKKDVLVKEVLAISKKA
jgi:hypothetical protein